MDLSGCHLIYCSRSKAIRFRLVHISDGDSLQELMIIYLENNDETGDVSNQEQSAPTERAIEGLTLTVIP